MWENGDTVRQSVEALRSAYAEDIRMAFSQRPYSIPTKYLYDFQGSLLFKEFAASSSTYYPHVEHEIIARHAERLKPILDVEQIIELGAGSCPRTGQLVELGLIASQTQYRPVDLSASPMVESLSNLRLQYPHLNAITCIGDFESWDVRCYANTKQTTLIVWLGNTAANTTADQLTATLDRLSRSFEHPIEVLLGIELAGERPNVKEHFPDINGAFTRFRWNALVRLNNTFEGNFDFDNFTLELEYNHKLSEAESFFAPRRQHCVALRALSLNIPFHLTDRLIIGITKDYTANTLTSVMSSFRWAVQTILSVPTSTYALVHLVKFSSFPNGGRGVHVT